MRRTRPVLDELDAGAYTSGSQTRTWRNWQTHQIRVRTPAEATETALAYALVEAASAKEW